jgi:hypothetical protein
MKKGLLLTAVLLVGITLVVGGCAKSLPEEGNELPLTLDNSIWFSDSLRWLTDDEKDRLIEIALSTPEALRQLEEESVYKAEVNWIAVDNSTWWKVDYEAVESGIPAYVPQSAVFYSHVLIRFGEPEQWQVMVAVDLDTEKVVFVEENPARNGPTPPEDAN